MGLKIGICGMGAFSRNFIALFKAHPLVDEVVLSDLIPERAQERAAQFDNPRTFGSLDALCESDVDAVVLMTQRQLHGPQALQALNAGKHVYSAVPIAQTVDEVRDIVHSVERTRLIYMTGETSTYMPCTIYCRERYQKGDFGRFVYSEGQYFHDMRHFYDPFRRSGGPKWKRIAGLPPMHYPTHSVSLTLSVTGAHVTGVSCLGVVDHHEDGIFRRGANLWNNVFSNETALMRTSDGGAMRINEFRRIGWRGQAGGVLMSLYGTKGCFETQANAQAWVSIDPEAQVDLTDLLKCQNLPVTDATRSDENAVVLQEFHTGVSKVHPVGRLPETFHGLPNGHFGSHQFLADDFVKAVATRTLPPNHVWASARYCIPGLVAHQSATNNGVWTDVPDLGDPPANWERLNPEADLA